MDNEYKSKILIAEDSATQALNLQFLLEEAGYRVEVSRNGKDALAAARQRPPDMLITDIVMPEMDGYELCHTLKNTSPLHHIPVILLTTLSDPLNVINDLKCGADSFVIKPYNKDFLLERIRYILTNRVLRHEESNTPGIEVFFAGQKHLFTAQRSQMLDLLLSTFENAIQKNIELTEMNNRLIEAEGRLREQANELRALSLTDPLTTLYNRRGFMTIASQLLRMANREGQYMWLLFLDVDGLKIVNDTLGHPQGDQLITDVSVIIRKIARESDVTARLGGDEFVVLIPNGSADDANRLSERLEKAAAAQNTKQDRPYGIAFSIGISEYNPEAPCTMDELIRRADTEMYKMKASHKARKPAPL
jgi:diguanylate cyclase (GGDEF)-like protein